MEAAEQSRSEEVECGFGLGPRLGWAGQGEGGLASSVGGLGTVVLWPWALAAWRQTGGAGGQNKRRMKPAAEVSRAWRRHDKTSGGRDRAGTPE